jgi:hypothetical protein
MPGWVSRVPFAPDGRHLFNGNGTIHVLRIEPPPPFPVR